MCAQTNAERKRLQSIGTEVDVHHNGLILVIDDERFLVDLMIEFLGISGLIGKGFTSGESAIEWFWSNFERVKLVFLDVRMPRMNGNEVFKRLRAINPDVQIAICSGYSSDEQTRELLELGATVFFKKPLIYQEVVGWVKNYLEMNENEVINL